MEVFRRLPIVGVIGSGSDEHAELASQVGQLLARLGVHLLTGGGQGVMLAVTRAFVEAPDRQGVAIGVLPCREGDPRCQPKPGYPNPWVELPLITHLPLSGRRGMEPLSRNHIIVLSSAAVIALPGGAGTGSEIQLAVGYGTPIIAFVGQQADSKNLDPRMPVARTIQEVEALLVDSVGTLGGEEFRRH